MIEVTDTGLTADGYRDQALVIATSTAEGTAEGATVLSRGFDYPC